PQPLPSAAWTALSPSPVALTEVAAASLGGQLWVAGGLDAAGNAVDAVLVYDPAFDGWSSGPTLPEPLHHATLVAAGGDLWLIGGYVGSSFATPTATVRRLDTATGGWTLGPPLPMPRAAGAAAWDGRRLVYGGGVGPRGVSGDVWTLDGAGWRALGTLSEPREHLAAASDGRGQVWLLAGRVGGLGTGLATVDLVSGEAVRRVGRVPTARGGVAGFYSAKAGACVAGGEVPTGTVPAVECVDEAGGTTPLPPLLTPRHGLGAAVVDGIAYVVLGGPRPGLHVSAAVEALRLDG
ncbi:MAG: hypothetical protein M3N52_03590, partial [Actinomycetota bacterium]|nr:hypothetical protein [Actinomycetota bacterium]